MPRILAKTRKLITKPGVFFRDVLLKKHPIPSLQHGGTQSTSTRTAMPAKKAPTKVDRMAELYMSKFDSLQVEPGLVLLDSYWGKKIGCNPYAIFRALQSDPRAKDFKYVWVKNPGVEIPEDVKQSPHVSYVAHMTEEWAEALLRAQYLISNMTFLPFFVRKPQQVYINLWHGIPIKAMGLDSDPALLASANTQRNFRLASKVMLAGEYAMEKTVVPYGSQTLATANTYLVGSPRIDLTLRADKADVRSRLGVRNNLPIVLYAPTWRGKLGGVSKDYNHQLAAIEALEAELQSTHNLFISLHHLDAANVPNLQNRVIRVVPEDVDMNEILAATDVLISDYSSILVDYLVLDLPIVLFLPDRASYESTRSVYIKAENLPALATERASELPHCVIASRKPSSFSVYDTAIKTLVPLEDGEAAQRAVNAILGGIDPKPSLAGAPAAGKKKILIFGGNMITNGVTSSLLSLLASINKDKYEVHLVLDAEAVDSDWTRKANLDRAKPYCELILRSGSTALNKAEKAIYSKFQRAEKLTAESLEILNNAFRREGRRVIGDHSFDIAIEFNGYSPYWGLLIANVNAARKVIYQHSDLHAEANNTHVERSKPLLNAVFRLYPLFDAVVSVSREIMEVNNKKLGEHYTQNTMVTYARNAFVPKTVRESSTSPLALISEKAALLAREPNLIKFISVGRLSPEKNHRRLVEAFAQVIANGLNAVLFVVGDGPLKTELVELARARGVSDRIIFTGALSNPHPLLAASDCLVFPSDYEGQGLVLLEALTLGVFCIGTDIPAVRAILADGAGFIADPTPHAFAAKMMEFARDPKKGVFGIDEYTKSAMQDFYTNVCAEIVG